MSCGHGEIPDNAILCQIALAMLSQWLQDTMLWIHQYRLHNIYKPGPDVYIADCLFYNNHAENKDQEIAGMSTNASGISTLVNMPVCTPIEDKQAVTWENAHLQEL